MPSTRSKKREKEDPVVEEVKEEPEVKKKKTKEVAVKDKGKEVEKIVNVAVLRLLLDESNHCIEAHVEDIITGGKSITIHNKTTSELDSYIDFN